MGDAEPASAIGAALRGAEQLGLIYVVNHGIANGLIDEFHDRVDRIMHLPLTEKAELASPTGHPYRGWRQWRDDAGLVTRERFGVAQFDNPQDALSAGLPAEYASHYAHINVWPRHDSGLAKVAKEFHDASVRLALRVLELYRRALG
ncbi:MAG: 2-oxoglutarate and iron-dependent oxygenase domain-containing protein, partial [Mycobacterium sp.]|nr:2-oxoglutarate and iron-dependent oxygenase domain-containing protein [Mycobacterium sp.]